MRPLRVLAVVLAVIASSLGPIGAATAAPESGARANDAAADRVTFVAFPFVNLVKTDDQWVYLPGLMVHKPASETVVCHLVVVERFGEGQIGRQVFEVDLRIPAASPEGSRFYAIFRPKNTGIAYGMKFSCRDLKGTPTFPEVPADFVYDFYELPDNSGGGPLAFGSSS